MFDNDFFAEETEEKRGGIFGRVSDYMGGGGMIGLHLAAVTYAIFSGYHGVHATAAYRAGSGLGMAAGVVGILTIELVLMSLYVAWHGQKITATAQTIAAAVTGGVGFILSFLAIVADSQITANVLQSGWLAGYVRWVLPASPAFMAVGAFFVHALSPEQIAARKQRQAEAKTEQLRHDAQVASLRAELDIQKSVTNMQLNSKAATAKLIGQAYTSPEVRAAIEETAAKNVPALLQAIGIYMPGLPAVGGQSQSQQTAGQGYQKRQKGRRVTSDPAGNGQPVIDTTHTPVTPQSQPDPVPAVNGHSKGAPHPKASNRPVQSTAGAPQELSAAAIKTIANNFTDPHTRWASWSVGDLRGRLNPGPLKDDISFPEKWDIEQELAIRDKVLELDGQSDTALALLMRDGDDRASKIAAYRLLQARMDANFTDRPAGRE